MKSETDLELRVVFSLSFMISTFVHGLARSLGGISLMDGRSRVERRVVSS